MRARGRGRDGANGVVGEGVADDGPAGERAACDAEEVKT